MKWNNRSVRRLVLEEVVLALLQESARLMECKSKAFRYSRKGRYSVSLEIAGLFGHMRAISESPGSR